MKSFYAEKKTDSYFLKKELMVLNILYISHYSSLEGIKLVFVIPNGRNEEKRR